MSKKKNLLIIFTIIILALLAGNLIYPGFLKLPFISSIPFRLGLDLQGGTHLIYEADLSNIDKEDYNSLMQGLRDVIERRVNLFGVAEPVVQIQKTAGHYAVAEPTDLASKTEGGYRLIVELAGIKDPGEAIKMIGETPYLEFKEQKSEDVIEKIKEKREEIEGKTEKEIKQIEGWELAYEDFFQPTELTGKYLKKAELDFDQTTYKPLVLLQFNDEGAKLFEEITARNVGKLIPVYIDGVLISAPTVSEAISGGRAQITGSFAVDEAKTLARNLSAGALPVPITLISQQSVGPTLGTISLNQSLKAGFYGFLAVIIFMIIFYRLPGLIASISLLIYIALILSIFKLVPVTITLAGIGGFILSVGMAVDANVLIFSRMREELKSGKNFSIALEDGFSRAWSSIRDGNLTTLIVAIILFGFGTSFIKGFALTLSLGILMSMFSAIIVTKNFLRIFVDTKFENIKFLWK